MKKVFENEEAFKKFIEEEYIREADALEAELFPEGEVIEADLSEEEVAASFERLTQKLKQDGVYDYHLDKENIGKRRLVRWHYPFDRTAVAIVLAGLGVLFASLSSAENREAIMTRFQYMTSVTAEILEEGVRP